MAKKMDESDPQDDENTTGKRKIRVGRKMGLGAVMMAEGIVKKGRRKEKVSSKPSRLEITPAKNGYMVTAYSDDGNGPLSEPKKYVYRNRDSMIAGISKNFDT